MNKPYIKEIKGNFLGLGATISRDRLVMSLKDKYTQEQILDAFHDLLETNIYTDITEQMIEHNIIVKGSDLYKVLTKEK